MRKWLWTKSRLLDLIAGYEDHIKDLEAEIGETRFRRQRAEADLEAMQFRYQKREQEFAESYKAAVARARKPRWARAVVGIWVLVAGIAIGGAAIPHVSDRPYFGGRQTETVYKVVVVKNGVVHGPCAKLPPLKYPCINTEPPPITATSP